MKTLIETFCADIGQQPLLVQGAGGNVSWKQDGVLWVKASGMRLANAVKQPVFVPVDLIVLQQALQAGLYDVLPTALDASGLRPSIETALHALMPHPVVVHLHMVDVLARLVCQQADTLIASRMPTNVSWVFVGYHKPGAALAKAVADALAERPTAQVVFLQNHGVVVGADTVEAITQVLEQLAAVFTPDQVDRPEINPLAPSIMDVLSPDMAPITDASLHVLAQQPSWLRHVINHWVLYPDHAVFLGGYAHVFSSIEELNLTPKKPALAFVDGVGVFTSKEFTLAKLEQLQCYRDVLQRLPLDELGQPMPLKPLTQSHIAELLNWDAEQYRQQLAIQSLANV
jgi:rhamnose utilization protein RhaD (predicted bifunctional aldolase and dehydrogenase)